MITLQQEWKSRVLEDGRLGIDAERWAAQGQWKLNAYERYRTQLGEPQYPCFFGQTAEVRGEMFYVFTGWNDLGSFAESMRTFTKLTGSSPYERSSLTAFFEPDASLTNHASFVTRFWNALQYLHEHDQNPVTDRAPDHPLWEFAFEGCEMFVVGASPTYQVRRSRNLGPGMVLIFQPRFLFIDPTTSQPIAAPVRHRIHKRMLAYDGITVHPDIGFYGNPGNREWKQYALPDDNEPETGVCPFHTRSSLQRNPGAA
jgi:uncharacterized protein